MQNSPLTPSSLLPYMTEIRRHLHKNPGAGFDNLDTIKYIKSKLDEMSVASQFVGKCGLSALIGDTSKPCFLLRADTDGLETTEKTGLPFASNNGRMHLCGHDLHTAQLLGAAKILKHNENKLRFCVKLMFQSAEENLCGAKDMIDSGILENPKPVCGMMIHVMTGTPLETGTVIVSDIPEAAPAADFFTVTFTGKGCHGSSPSEGRNPIPAACSTVSALTALTSSELAMSDFAVVSIGSFRAGDAPNVIPEKAVISGSMRCFGKDIREYLKSRVCEIPQNIAKAYGITAETKFTGGCPSLLNSPEICDSIYKKLCSVLGENTVKRASEFGAFKTSGSEDFAYISQEIPTVMLALCAGKSDDGYIHPLHNPKTDFDEQAMINGCTAFISAVI